MFKTKFQGRTEDETFSFMANPMHLRECATVILAQYGASFLEISDTRGRIVLMASYNDGRADGQKFQLTYPADDTED